MTQETDVSLVEGMRESKIERAPRRSFMHPDEVRRLRRMVIRVTQQKLAEQMLKPESGEPVSNIAVCRWERGMRPVPLWAARRLRHLAEVAAKHDLNPQGEPE